MNILRQEKKIARYRNLFIGYMKWLKSGDKQLQKRGRVGLDKVRPLYDEAWRGLFLYRCKNNM